MTILEKDITWYIDQFDRPFSFPGYSDAEWFCMIGEREGDRTGQGQLLSTVVAQSLKESLRHHDDRFFPAFPKILNSFPQGERIRELADGSNQTWYERDMVTDDLAAKAGLYPLISKLQTMKVGVVGNKHLRGLSFLNYTAFFEIAEQDFHLKERALRGIIRDILKDTSCDIYIFSAGISAAMMIGQLHGKKKAVLFDCGSMWDAFVGIGRQREWREKLYKDPEALAAWQKKNVYGKF